MSRRYLLEINWQRVKRNIASDVDVTLGQIKITVKQQQSEDKGISRVKL